MHCNLNLLLLPIKPPLCREDVFHTFFVGIMKYKEQAQKIT